MHWETTCTRSLVPLGSAGEVGGERVACRQAISPASTKPTHFAERRASRRQDVSGGLGAHLASPPGGRAVTLGPPRPRVAQAHGRAPSRQCEWLSCTKASAQVACSGGVLLSSRQVLRASGRARPCRGRASLTEVVAALEVGRDAHHSRVRWRPRRAARRQGCHARSSRSGEVFHRAPLPPIVPDRVSPAMSATRGSPPASRARRRRRTRCRHALAERREPTLAPLRRRPRRAVPPRARRPARSRPVIACSVGESRLAVDAARPLRSG